MKAPYNNQRTFVLGIDGVPYSFLKQKFAQRQMCNLAKMAEGSGMRRMNSVYPTVSSVAWTTYMTGVNPALHNIFGFVDRTASPFGIKIPTAGDRKGKAIWTELSQKGKKVIVINVPLTYPPQQVNGILISGFLSADIKKCSYPTELSTYLKSKGYIIDVNAWLARNNQKGKFMKQLHRAMEKRFELTLELMGKQEWDFFQLHIMETDRLLHFFWNDIDNQTEFSDDVKIFFRKLDDFIGNLRERLSEKDRLLVLSDHGFCGIKNEVQLNVWLKEQGLLKFGAGTEQELDNYDESSTCYSLIPGRIFINLQGREDKGSVSAKDYERVRQDIKQRLLSFQNPDNGEKIVDKVFLREEIYQGPYLENAADIIAHPVKGYDLKGSPKKGNIFESSALGGMHTYDDAFVCGINFDISFINSIQDIKDLIIN